MNTQIQIFKNSQFGEVRVAEVNGELHFVAKDVAERLGYNWQRNLVGHVPEEWKGVNPINTPSGIQEVITLSEQGLYFFLARSDKPAALPFQKWIAGEVIPSIRKHGGYLTPDKIEEALLNPDTIIQLATNLKEERRKRIDAEKQALALKPKATFYDTVLEPANECLSLSQAAKILKLPYGRNTLCKVLRDRGIFFKNTNEPKQEYIERGYFKVFENPIDRDNHPSFLVLTSVVTQKGLLFISKLLEIPIQQKIMATTN